MKVQEKKAGGKRSLLNLARWIRAEEGFVMQSSSWRGKRNICREEGALPGTGGMADNGGRRMWLG